MMQNTAKKIITIILRIVLVIFILLGILFGFSILPIKNNYKLYAITSGSMGSTIPIGSVVIAEPIGVYEIGDIITYQSTISTQANSTITHRIIDKKFEHNQFVYTLKGDSNIQTDQIKVTQEMIVGKVYYHLPYLGYLVRFVKTLYGLILLVIVPATVVIYEELKKIKEETKKLISYYRQNRGLKQQKRANHG